MTISSEGRQISAVERPADGSDLILPYSPQLLGGMAAGFAVFALDTKILPAWKQSGNLQHLNYQISEHQVSLATLNDAEKLMGTSGAEAQAKTVLETKATTEKQQIATLETAKHHVGNEALVDSQIFSIPAFVAIATAAFLIKRNRRRVREYDAAHGHGGYHHTN